MVRKHQQRYPQKTLNEKDKRIAELEALLKQKELAVDALELLIEDANEMYGTDLKKSWYKAVSKMRAKGHTVLLKARSVQ